MLDYKEMEQRRSSSESYKLQLASSQNKPFKWKPIAHTRDAAAAEPLNFADFCCGQMAPHYLSSSLIEVRRPAAASKHSLQGQNLGGKKKAQEGQNLISSHSDISTHIVETFFKMLKKGRLCQRKKVHPQTIDTKFQNIFFIACIGSNGSIYRKKCSRLYKVLLTDIAVCCM